MYVAVKDIWMPMMHRNLAATADPSTSTAKKVTEQWVGDIAVGLPNGAEKPSV